MVGQGNNKPRQEAGTAAGRTGKNLTKTLAFIAIALWAVVAVAAIQAEFYQPSPGKLPLNFFIGPGATTAAMSVLPMALLPGFFVPLFFIAHMEVLLQVRRLRAGVLAAA